MSVPTRFSINQVLNGSSTPGPVGPQGAPGPQGVPGAAFTPPVTFASLASTTPSSTPKASVIVDCYSTPGDGGGGTFVWHPTSTATPDGGVVVQVTGIATGRWIRVFTGPFDVRWFGAKGDGATDDSTAINKAIIAAGYAGGVVFFSRVAQATAVTTYAVANPIVIDGLNVSVGIKLLGDSSSSDSATTYQTRLIWTGFVTAAGTAASITTVANDQYGHATIVTITGLSGIGSVKVGDSITISGAASAANNGTGTIVSLPGGGTSVTARLVSYTLGTSNILPVASDANNGALHWKCRKPMVKVYSGGVAFENLGFHGSNSSCAALIECTNGTSSVTCTNIQFRNCGFFEGTYGIKIGDYGPNTTQPGNCDQMLIEDCYFSTCENTAYIVPNQGGQAKLHIFSRAFFVTCPRGILFESGSFRVLGALFGQMGYLTGSGVCMQSLAQTDVISIIDVDVENTAKLYVQGLGISGGPSASGWPTEIHSVRMDNAPADFSANGMVVEIISGAANLISGCEFSQGVSGIANCCIGLIGTTSTRAVQLMVQGCTFGQPAGTPIVQTSGANSAIWHSFSCMTDNGTPGVVPDGVHYIANSGTTGAPPYQIANLSVFGQGLTIATGANNNLANPHVTGLTIAALGSAANITGIVAGDAWQVIDITNGSGQTVTLNHANAGSIAGNRFNSPTGADYSIAAGVTTRVAYDPTNAVWQIRSFAASGGSFTAAGDLTGSSSSQQVVSLTGASNAIPIAATGAVLTWANTTASPGFAQTALASTSAGSGANGATLTILPQGGQAATGASHNGGNGGLLSLQGGPLGTSGSATAGQIGNVESRFGSNGMHAFYSNGFLQAALGYTSAGSGFGALYLGSGSAGLTPTNNNYALLSNGSDLFVQAISGGGSLKFGMNNSVYLTWNPSGNNWTEVYSNGLVSIAESHSALTSTAATPGTVGSPWTRTAQAGQATTAATGTGGAGAAVSVTAGAGGGASGATSSTGGTGGAINIVAGLGGQATGAGTKVGGIGGPATISSGAGGTGASQNIAGSLVLQTGGNTQFSLSPQVGSGVVLAYGQTSVALSTGTFTPIPAPVLSFSGPLTGAVTIVLPNVIGTYYLDFQDVVLGAFGITVSVGSKSVVVTTLLTAFKELLTANVYAANKLAVG